MKRIVRTFAFIVLGVAALAAAPIVGSDYDGDGLENGEDNCATDFNSNQQDTDADGIGDACDAVNDDDVDADGTSNFNDNCPTVHNATQLDADADDVGDACDSAPFSPDPDADDDGFPNGSDNCPTVVNASQSDQDADGLGDACDAVDSADADGDGVPNIFDNCRTVANPDQDDDDTDVIGNACDPENDDDDSDGVFDEIDSCPATPPGTIVNASGCSIADLCPCVAPWQNHGAYVSCVRQHTDAFLSESLITNADRSLILSQGGRSSCGK
jgi:hypothetical protein